MAEVMVAQFPASISPTELFEWTGLAKAPLGVQGPRWNRSLPESQVPCLVPYAAMEPSLGSASIPLTHYAPLVQAGGNRMRVNPF